MQMRYVFLMMLALFSAQAEVAAEAKVGETTISDSWARATAPGQTNGAIYLTIASQKEASIVAVSSAIANSASLHSMTHEDGIMKMRELDVLPLPARQEVKLNSGGNHIMLDGLKRPLKVGDSVPLILTVQYADQRIEKFRLTVQVKPLTLNHSSHENHQDH